MKAEIKEGLIILIPETKKEKKKVKKLIKDKAASGVIPASVDQLAYFHFQDISIAIL